MQLFSWIALNWQTVCSWSAGLFILYRLVLVLNCFTSAATRFKNSEDAIQRVETTLQLVANNHLTHIQSEIEQTNGKLDHTNQLLSDLKDDIRLVLFGKMAADRE